MYVEKRITKTVKLGVEFSSFNQVHLCCRVRRVIILYLDDFDYFLKVTTEEVNFFKMDFMNNLKNIFIIE